MTNTNCKIGEVTYKTHILVKAMEAVYKNQGQEYGNAADNFADIADIWSIVLGIEITPKQVGLCMIGTKICREKTSHNPDNLIDIAGYAEATMQALVERVSAKTLEEQTSEIGDTVFNARRVML